MKDQRHGKEVRAQFFSSHVVQTVNVHELMTKDSPAIQERKETSGHP